MQPDEPLPFCGERFLALVLRTAQIQVAPATCLTEALRRFQPLINAIDTIKAASASLSASMALIEEMPGEPGMTARTIWRINFH